MGGGGAAPPPSFTPTITTLPFLFLSLDLPPAPLFREDSKKGKEVPQLPVFALLQRFDGVTVTQTLRGQFWERRKYRLLRLPRVLTLVFKRFARNAFFTEKNRTIVTFPTRNFELSPYVDSDALSRARATARRSASAPPPAVPTAAASRSG